jgi:four helix bundle protein
MPFAHEKLHVYQKGLDCFASLRHLLSSWSRRHAFVDHLSRAMESILFNLVEAVRLHDTAKKLLAMDYAVGSTCESAACLDIAILKGMLDAADGTAEKRHLLEICRMLIGLRKSWTRQRVAESECDYASAETSRDELLVFHHEALDMYRTMLACYRWLVSTEAGRHLRSASERSVDALATRILLSIAEGNGRYAELSQQAFLDTANAAAAKLAVSLDMGSRRGVWHVQDVAHAKELLLRVGQMTARKGYVA